MENSMLETLDRISLSFKKFSGLIVASLIILTVFLTPAIPTWAAIVALYPMLTSIVDIYLEIVG